MKIGRLCFFAMGCMVLLGVLTDKVEAAKLKKPNVLFIAVDDLRTDLGCYGDDYIITPHIDRFAESAMVFNRAHCQVAVCNASRASLMTGLRSDSVRVWDLRVHFRETTPDAVTIPQHFKQNGYFTTSFGKIYHTMYGAMEDPASWSEPKEELSGHWIWTKEQLKTYDAFKEEKRKLGWPEPKVKRIRPPAIVCEDVLDNQRFDGNMVDHALVKLGELKDRDEPFFLGVGFVQPHLPFRAPKKYWDLYDREKIPLAKNPGPVEGAPPMAMNTMYELRDYMDFIDTPLPSDDALTEAQQRELKHGYCASVSYIDAQMGRLLDYLDESGLAENTIVVLWGDHGWKLGEHQSWCKQSNYEIDTHVPLIFRSPTAKAKGEKTDALVEFIDVYPTLCDLAGLPIPAHAEGRSLKPLLDDPTQPWSDAAFSQYARHHKGVAYMGNTIRTDRYRYVEWINMETMETTDQELYDHKNDPMENSNVAGRPENKELLESLSKKLRETCPKLAPDPGVLARGYRSANSNVKTTLTIENKRKEPVDIYWVEPNGHRVDQGRLQPGKIKKIKTQTTHTFVAVGNTGAFTKRLTAGDYEGKVALLK